MARKEANLTCCMLTQALQPQYWNWTQVELQAISSGDVKSVTDLCDGGESTYEEFSRNLKAASKALRQVNEQIINELLR